ncbi:MAG TPA: hypothetical protein VFW11_25110 [Cyclobacteriaceae bacterium]|nr:hypothetical protein [Cyclobacteriaceae bacterium]
MNPVKYILPSLLILISGCGGSLSKEQREEMKEARSKQEIKKVSEAELLEATISQGRELVRKTKAFKLTSADTTYQIDQIDVRWLRAGTEKALDIEKQIIDAYIIGAINGDLPENVQFLGEDSLLYTQPVVEKLPDGAIEVKGMWSIAFSRKEVVLHM